MARRSPPSRRRREHRSVEASRFRYTRGPRRRTSGGCAGSCWHCTVWRRAGAPRSLRGSKTHIFFVVAGSHVAFVDELVLGGQALYGRVTGEIRVLTPSTGRLVRPPQATRSFSASPAPARLPRRISEYFRLSTTPCAPPAKA